MFTEVSFNTCLRFLGLMSVNCVFDNDTTVVKKISFRNYNNKLVGLISGTFEAKITQSFGSLGLRGITKHTPSQSGR